MPKYRVERGGLHDRFLRCRSKIQIFGGAFANGKSAGLCIKALNVAKDYPGANILLGRATYPKLMDTLLKEFQKWCPKDWIASFPKTPIPTCYLTNGTVINFRYVQQQKSNEASTSNLLSATYDFIGIDQMEDPEITSKDFHDLLGRLRGSARYVGKDPTMPKTGPRWLVMTCNPARNWLYRELVKPLKDLELGIKNDQLIVDADTGEPIVELFEGTTYDNKHNLESDFIKTLEVTYTGQMRDRFLLGEWAAYEGLVYKDFDESMHVVPHQQMEDLYYRLKRERIQPTLLEGYDYGLAVPSCYLLAFVDLRGNVHILDGFYEAECAITTQCNLIDKLRRKYAVSQDEIAHSLADPSIFRRGTSNKNVVGKSVNDLFFDEGIRWRKGDNDIIAGITKMQGYLMPREFHVHPYTGADTAPHLYVSDKLTFFRDEITEYYWKRDTSDEVTDKPNDRKDHAMDTTKYLLSRQPPLAKLLFPRPGQKPKYMSWHEYEQRQDRRNKRHAA